MLRCRFRGGSGAGPVVGPKHRSNTSDQTRSHQIRSSPHLRVHGHQVPHEGAVDGVGPAARIEQLQRGVVPLAAVRLHGGAGGQFDANGASTPWPISLLRGRAGLEGGARAAQPARATMAGGCGAEGWLARPARGGSRQAPCLQANCSPAPKNTAQPLTLSSGRAHGSFSAVQGYPTPRCAHRPAVPRDRAGVSPQRLTPPPSPNSDQIRRLPGRDRQARMSKPMALSSASSLVMHDSRSSAWGELVVCMWGGGIVWRRGVEGACVTRGHRGRDGGQRPADASRHGCCKLRHPAPQGPAPAGASATSRRLPYNAQPPTLISAPVRG